MSESATIESPPQIRLSGVSLEYRPAKAKPVLAIDGVDLEVTANRFVSIIGPSGCGKSTLLKIISRVVSASRGTVEIDGVPVSDVEFAGRLSFMFQQPLLMPWRNVSRNVRLPLEVQHKRLSPAHEERVAALIEKVGLHEAANLLPHQLSGGMRQRVALARALVTQPAILLMDEPFGAVDEITREVLQEELLRIWQATKTTIILVTHHIEEAVLLSDEVVVISDRPGRVLKVLPVELPRPRDAELRERPEFHRMVAHLRQLLHPQAHHTRGDN